MVVCPFKAWLVVSIRIKAGSDCLIAHVNPIVCDEVHVLDRQLSGELVDEFLDQQSFSVIAAIVSKRETVHSPHFPVDYGISDHCQLLFDMRRYFVDNPGRLTWLHIVFQFRDPLQHAINSYLLPALIC